MSHEQQAEAEEEDEEDFEAARSSSELVGLLCWPNVIVGLGWFGFHWTLRLLVVWYNESARSIKMSPRTIADNSRVEQTKRRAPKADSLAFVRYEN